MILTLTLFDNVAYVPGWVCAVGLGVLVAWVRWRLWRR